MPNYQFVSTNLAHRFPRHLASRIVLSYESVYPRTITAQRWPGSATMAQVLCGCERWSSGLGFESIGYVLFSYSAMWVAVLTPRWMQQVWLTGLLSLTVWCLVMLVNYTQESFTGGVSLAGGVAALVLMVIVSYFFSWDYDSDSSPVKKNEALQQRVIKVTKTRKVAPSPAATTVDAAQPS
eukprot:gene13783-17603_t